MLVCTDIFYVLVPSQSQAAGLDETILWLAEKWLYMDLQK